MAINRQTLARADLTGLNWPPRTMGNHFFVNTQTGYRDNSSPVRFDPVRARQLLDQAGWRQSGAFRSKGGRQLSLRFVIPAGVAVSRQEGLLAQGMLRRVGVKLDLRTVPENDFFIKYVTPGNFDITPFSWLGTAFPISSASVDLRGAGPGPGRRAGGAAELRARGLGADRPADEPGPGAGRPRAGHGRC